MPRARALTGSQLVAASGLRPVRIAARPGRLACRASVRFGSARLSSARLGSLSLPLQLLSPRGATSRESRVACAARHGMTWAGRRGQVREWKLWVGGKGGTRTADAPCQPGGVARRGVARAVRRWKWYKVSPARIQPTARRIATHSDGKPARTTRCAGTGRS